MNLKGKGWTHPGRRSSDYGKTDFNDHDRRTYSSIGQFRFTLQDEIRELFSKFKDEWPDLAPLNQNGFVPHIDVIDQGNHFIVIADIPGMEGNDINLSLDKDILTIEGEKKCSYQEKTELRKSEISYGHFLRDISFDEKVDEDNVEASYRDGVLRVIIQKRLSAGKNKKIHVQTKKQLQ